MPRAKFLQCSQEHRVMKLVFTYLSFDCSILGERKCSWNKQVHIHCTVHVCVCTYMLAKLLMQHYDKCLVTKCVNVIIRLICVA